MLDFDPQLLKTLLTVAFSAGGVYAAIRADIKNIYSKLASMEKDDARIENTAVRAHDRMDHHVVDYHRSAKNG